MCNELTNDAQSSRNKHFIMSIYAVCFSVIKSCTYWDPSTLQALHEHACMFYEKCNVESVGKMPSNITVYDAEIKIKYSHLNQGSLTHCYLWGGGGGVQEINYICAILCPTGPR